jgi:hypothetical protein
MIAAAAGAFALRHNRLSLLQWQSRKQCYEAVKLTFDMSTILVDTATLENE